MSEIKLTINGTDYELEPYQPDVSKLSYGYGAPAIWLSGNFFLGKAIPKEKDIPEEFDYDVLCWECKDGKDGYKRPSTVKRLSDNETFNINDTTNKGKIYRFEIRNGELLVGIENSATMHYLNHIEKVKPKVALFTTADLKEVFEQDTYPIYKVDKEFQILQYAACDCANWDDAKYYYSKEKAEEYILLNKPIELSLNQIFNEICVDSTTLQQLKAFFKSKINL